MGEAIEERAGEALGAEHLGPFVERQIGGESSRASMSSWTSAAAVMKPTERPFWQAARPRPRAMWVLPVCGGDKLDHGSGGICPAAGGVKLCHL